MTLQAELRSAPPPQYHHYNHGQFPQRRHRPPSYKRRQDRRQAQAAVVAADDSLSSRVSLANVSSEENDGSKVAEEATETEEVNEIIESKNASDTEAEVAVSEFECLLCDFKSNWKNGLAVHMKRKHSQIEQLDGNLDLSTLENDDEDIYESTKHYWKTGYLGGAFQSYIDAIELVEDMNLGFDEMIEEKAKILDARKNALGENHKYYLPWSKT